MSGRWKEGTEVDPGASKDHAAKLNAYVKSGLARESQFQLTETGRNSSVVVHLMG